MSISKIMLSETEFDKIKETCDCSKCQKRCNAEGRFIRLPSVLGGMGKCARLKGKYR